MEENDINEDQIESIIQYIAAYSLRHNISYDTAIKSGREALYLEEKYDIPVEKIPELIIQAKERIDRLEDQTQEILRKKQQAREELDAIVEKYEKDIPLIERIKQLEEELAETKRSEKSYKTYCKRLAQDVEMLDNLNIEHVDSLSKCCEEIEKLKEANENSLKATAENRELRIYISNMKTVEKQLAEKDSGQINEGNKSETHVN